MSGAPYRWIDRDADFEALVDELADEPRYAIDTEFHRERTYFAKLALVQIAWEGGIALVDPLTVDISYLAKLLNGPGLAVFHAAQQDLEVLARACGTVPAHLFDTQLAAGFTGYSTPALMNLVQAELGLRLPKGDRLTDWLHRPLTDDQRSYAASDVEHLLALHDRLTADLERRGRLQWALAECEELRSRPTGPPDPELAWLRLKDHRNLRGSSRGVAQALGAWRERRAAATDQPVRFVLADLAILGMAQRPPRSLEELKKVRGLDDRNARGALGESLLAAVTEGLALPVEQLRVDPPDEVDRRLRPAVTLVSAWVSQVARSQAVDTALLATRSDLVALLAGDPDARLAHGWRAEMIGGDIADLVAGRAALAFDGNAGLLLEPRVGADSPADAG
ncbi:MAG: ribonuclease D [Acidimicrobiia bacterium]